MKETIEIKNKNGEKKEFDVIFTFESTNTNQTYITYTDYEKDEEGNIKCYSGYFKGEKLLPVTAKEELTIIEEMLKTITTSIKNKFVINNNNDVQ